MNSHFQRGSERRARATTAGTALTLAGLACVVCSSAISVPSSQQDTAAARNGPVLEETRLVMGKWIETQQIISKERNDWQQGREILSGRLELVGKEIAGLKEKIKETELTIAKNESEKEALTLQSAEAEAVEVQLAQVVTRLESEVQRLFKTLPEPVQTKLRPLQQRIPEDPATTKVTLPERFQNVLVILSGVNTANTEINVNYEVHTLEGGKPSEVKAIYVGLAQAYYVSASGEAGIGRPSSEGWTWQPSKAIADDVLKVLEIQQSKHSPAFVPLPVTIQ